MVLYLLLKGLQGSAVFSIQGLLLSSQLSLRANHERKSHIYSLVYHPIFNDQDFC